MPKLHRALVIDPDVRSITAVQCDGSRESAYALLGSTCLNHFRIADYPKSTDYAWCSDLALQGSRPVAAFLLSQLGKPIGGRCVLFGVSKEGCSICDARSLVEPLRRATTWLGVIVPGRAT